MLRGKTGSELWRTIQQEVASFRAWQTKCRQWLHSHPELSFEEEQTGQYIQNELQSMKIPFTENWGVPPWKNVGHGIVAKLGTMKDPCILLRSDMDALPIAEETNLSFASTNLNVMHACGHDVHMAVLLGVAKYFKAHEKDINGTIQLVFQPAEEKGGGAYHMIQEGCLKLDPVPRVAFGVHVSAFHDVGIVASRPNTILGAVDSFTVVVEGCGGHASAPHMCNDPVSTAALIIINLNTFVARHMATLQEESTGVISVTSITAGEAHNVIPNSATLRGTLRALSDAQLEILKKAVLDICEHTAAMYKQKATVTLGLSSYPALKNSAKVFEWSKQKIDQADPSILETLRYPYFASEDFAYFAQKLPACFYLIGVKTKGKLSSGNIHTSTFKVDEDALTHGSTLLVFLASSALSELNRDPNYFNV